MYKKSERKPVETKFQLEAACTNLEHAEKCEHLIKYYGGRKKVEQDLEIIKKKLKEEMWDKDGEADLDRTQIKT